MKKRLDQLLVEKQLFPSRTKAQAAILAGLIFVNGQRSDKSGQPVPSDAEILIKGDTCPYVGRGGLKLEKALKEFNIDLKEKICLDIGASTGGFTDCMLQHGARQIYAIDVGYGQLDWKLRKDKRVKTVEKTNVRYLTAETLYQGQEKAGFAAIDVSFISLKLILPIANLLLSETAEAIALIKPQFEAERKQVGKGGIVKDEKVHLEVIDKVKQYAQSAGFLAKGLITSPIQGADGNKEFLLYLSKEPT
jgi:23S rRNA (cytidine1920-2'-O)/16S rRNA (cytidine1409-2'-O)-methyltransferase